MIIKHFLKITLSSATLQIRRISCWSCGKNVSNSSENLFCKYCNVLQRPDAHKNYFMIMGVKETFDINEQELAAKYKDLQKHLHPDKFVNMEREEQEISAQYSSIVNDAYKTLLNPMSRGIYMLSLSGKELPENTEIDNSFLMEIMDKNEEVENAESEEVILKLNEENKTVLKNLQEKISKAFFLGDFKSVIKLLSRMKYYTSIDSQIQSSIRNKGIIR